MKYKINHIIIFDSEKNILGLSSSLEDAVIISSPAKRLLLLLIVQQGKIVTRENIFRKVWDQYGMVSSNNNLNHCVSKLRKVIKELGVYDEIIVTVPKLGFMLSEHALIEPYVEVCDDSKIKSKLSCQHANMLSLFNRERLSHNGKGHWFQRCFCQVMAVLIILFIFTLARSEPKGKEISLGVINQCNIIFSSPSHFAMTLDDRVQHAIVAYVEHFLSECANDEYILVIPGIKRTYNSQSDIPQFFFSRCYFSKKDQIELCTSPVNTLDNM